MIMIQLAAIALPASLVLYYVLNTGLLPDNDYWGVVSRLLSSSGISRSPSDWLARSNEHVVVIPKILYILNFLASHGANRGLALLAWTAASLQLVILIFLVPKEIRTKPSTGFLLALILAIFVFTPRASHNWIMGMSGIAWITANLFAITAIFSLHQLSHTERPVWLALSLLSAILGDLTYSTAFAIWPALVLGAWVLRLRWVSVLAFAVVGILVYGIYLHGYEKPSGHPEFELSLRHIAVYTLTFIGGAFTTKTDRAIILGGIGITAWLLLAGYLLWDHRDEKFRSGCVPWFLLQVYVLGNALMAALSRGGFGLKQAFASRYASLPALFWCALLVLSVLSLYWIKPRHSRILSAVLLSITVLLVAEMHYRGYRDAKYLLEREQDKRLASVSLVTGAYDFRLLRESVSPAVSSQLIANIDAFRSQGHVPFVRPFITCPSVGKSLTGYRHPLTSGESQVRGVFDVMIPVNKRIIRVEGWAYSRGTSIACIAITNQDMIVQGMAVTGYSRANMAAALKIEDSSIGWAGYAHLQPGNKELRAYAFLEEPAAWYRLHHTHMPYPPLSGASASVPYIESSP